MEKLLINSSLQSRSSFELIKEYVNFNKHDRRFAIIMGVIDEYYTRDPDAGMVNRDILLALIAATLKNEKHLRDFTEIVDESIATVTSATNIKQVILLAKQREVGDELATAITNGKDHTELLERYNELHRATTLEETLSEQGVEVFDKIDVMALVAQENADGSYIKLYPNDLNDRLDGGLKPGHHVIAFGRPEAGKSAFAISAACGFARQGYKTLYVINEDRPADIQIRMICNLAQYDKHMVYANPDSARTRAESQGLGNLIVASLSPGTPKQIEEYIEKYEAQCVVVDQLRNVKVRAGTDANKTSQLEVAATQIRTLTKKWNVATVSVTQAGDSASNKAVLEMSDIDSSKTGIPAQADLMVGIGVTSELDSQNLRQLSLPKNKLSGDHSSFLVRIEPKLSNFRSY